ncbi:hypothetical protein PF001_g28660 [Phytophthora fragariae]|uniref:Uncharacterized protein n=4 Tax=Phytophthora fragariae TaxID=53985 RepID=A0A6A4BCA5_9STRA|nr:hypothetical protein PF001_g28660 [Phytophthora fragariae]
MNAFELLDRQNEVIVACGKSRSGIPASVLSTMLSVAFEPEEQVPLIRPDTLAVVLVRRQHIVDCEMDSRSNNPNDVFVDRLLPAPPTSAPEPLPTDLPLSNCMDMAFSDSDDEGKTEDPTEQANISLVRLQNRRLRKRTRDSDEDGSGLLPADDIDNPTLSLSSDAQASSFRPSQMERYVHNAVAHPSLRGKNAQAILESVQQGRQTQFLATPPVLRLAYDFSFHVRGLSLMHFRRFMEELEQQPTMSGVNMTNFGRVNSLHPATPPRTVSDIVEAFNTQLLFADRFYSPLVYSFIKAGATFMEKYAVLSRPDPATCNMLVFWVNSKLGKFRSEVIATNVQTAALIGNEFARNDDHLMELFQAQQERQVTALVASRTSRAAPGSRPSHSRDQRTQKPSAVPRELSSMLPKQGNKTLCMRYISKKGCTGPAPGLCFDPNRAHFRPIALPADAKAFIDKNFFGLGQEYQDL